jgi:large subunit ribosomal protein L5
MGVSASLEKGAVEDAAKDMTMITGRKPVISKSRHSIANFKLREGQPIGCRVTLRKDAMYEFFDRLVATALPRIRDFRGLSPRKFDGRGNYTFGVATRRFSRKSNWTRSNAPGHGHHDCDHGADDEEALDLLKLMGIPFAEK